MTRRPARALVLLGVMSALLFALAGLSTRATSATVAIAAETSGSVGSSATTRTPLPLRMARIGDAQQLLIAVCNNLGDTTGTLQVWSTDASGSWVSTMSVPCRFGRNGVMDGTERHAGNKTTPTGLWKMPGFLFGYHDGAPSGAKMRWKPITKKSWWSSKYDATYNTWVEAKKWPGEYLYGVSPQYEIAVSTGYNAKPNTVVMGRGSGIFLHIWGKGYTSGCIAIARPNMVRIAKLLDPAKHPAFAVGTRQVGSATAIWAY